VQAGEAINNRRTNAARLVACNRLIKLRNERPPVIESNTVLLLKAIWIFCWTGSENKSSERSSDWNPVCMVTSNDSVGRTPLTGYGWAIIESCLIWKDDVIGDSKNRRSGGKEFMTKTLEREIDRTVRRKRKEISEIREEVEDLLDYLDLLEARVKDAGNPQVNHEEIKKRYR
jgi:hypothetical protein